MKYYRLGLIESTSKREIYRHILDWLNTHDSIDNEIDEKMWMEYFKVDTPVKLTKDRWGHKFFEINGIKVDWMIL